MKVIEFDSKKDMEEMGEFFGELANVLEEKLNEIKKKSTPRKEAQVKRKRELMKENSKLEDQLEEVTSNTYAEIGEFMNEYLEKENALMKELYKKCKNWLDENDMPYEN